MIQFYIIGRIFTEHYQKPTTTKFLGHIRYCNIELAERNIDHSLNMDFCHMAVGIHMDCGKILNLAFRNNKAEAVDNIAAVARGF
jgi:hypothetical protein